jgi:hypothetical protein
MQLPMHRLLLHQPPLPLHQLLLHRAPDATVGRLMPGVSSRRSKAHEIQCSRLGSYEVRKAFDIYVSQGNCHLCVQARSIPASSCVSDMTAFLVQVHQATTSCSTWTAAAYLTCLISEPSGSNQKWRVTTLIHRLIAAAAKACDAATMCMLMLAMACSCEPASGGSLMDLVKICARSTIQRASVARCFSCLPSFPSVL